MSELKLKENSGNWEEWEWDGAKCGLQWRSRVTAKSPNQAGIK